MAMYRFAVGQMKDEERRQILEILRPCCPDMFSMQPAIEHQQLALSPLSHEAAPTRRSRMLDACRAELARTRRLRGFPLRPVRGSP